MLPFTGFCLHNVRVLSTAHLVLVIVQHGLLHPAESCPDDWSCHFLRFPDEWCKLQKYHG